MTDNTMREFYFKDTERNVAYQGVVPNNDTNCPPFEYYRLLYAEMMYKNLAWVLSVKCPNHVPEQYVRKYALGKTDELIAKALSKSHPNSVIHQLLSDDSLSKKQQETLLKDAILTGSEILWLNKEAQDLGYLLDVYHEETYPDKFNEKRMPIVFNQKEDGSFDVLGSTDMTEGELRALLEQRKVVQARIYHRNSSWHCFYYTFKGLAGEECGVLGSQPHYHYLSNRSGVSWDTLLKRIKACNMPTSKVHIRIKHD